MMQVGGLYVKKIDKSRIGESVQNIFAFCMFFPSFRYMKIAFNKKMSCSDEQK